MSQTKITLKRCFNLLTISKKQISMSRLYTFSFRKEVALSIFLMCCLAGPAFSQVSLVVDLSPSAIGDDYEPKFYPSFESNSSVSYFIANGNELWISDGTAAGTKVVKRLPSLTEIEIVGNRVFLTAASETTGSELWVSDGTESGTVMVKDIYPGNGSSSPSSLLNVNGVLYFSANNKTNGRELWKSDGTAGGTQLVDDIRPGAASSNPSKLVNLNGTIFFKANDGVSGYELWSSTGTTGGTALVKDINAGIADGAPNHLTISNGVVMFAATAAGVGNQLWKSDGTLTGTTLVKAIRPGGSSSKIDKMIDVNGTVFFEAEDGVHGLELWKSDGTETGTALVKDFTPGSGSMVSYGSQHLNHFTKVGNKLYLLAVSTEEAPRLWVTDGTPAGTVKLTGGLDFYFGFLTPTIMDINNEAYFFANYSSNISLLKSDGTNVTLVKENAAASYGPSLFSHNTIKINGVAYYIANQSLWKTDGTTGGTQEVAWIGFPASSYIEGLVDADGKLLFSGSNITGVYVSDGTESGTVQLSNSLSSFGAIGYNGIAYLANQRPWKSDGTAAGTTQLSSIATNPTQFTGANGNVLFAASSATHGSELWITDGTAAATQLLADIRPGTGSSSPSSLTAVGDKVFFTADAPVVGRALFVSDGTSAGTTLVKDINPTLATTIFKKAAFNDRFLFQTNDGVHGVELWSSDGTEAGTSMIKDFRPDDLNSGWNESDITRMIATDNTVILAALNELGKISLWKTNGLAGGTTKLRDFETSNFPIMLGAAGANVFFMIYNGTTNTELWKTNGLAGGTLKLKTFPPSFFAPENQEWDLPPVAASGDVMYFVSGFGLYRSDGTKSGTYLVPFDGDIYEMAESGGYVYLSGRTPDHGVELFVIDDSFHATASARRISAEETPDFQERNISGYPNPFKSDLAIRVNGEENESFKLKVVAMDGKTISDDVSLACNVSHNIGESWKTGIYLLQIWQNNKLVIKKVAKID
jgi:ELWxxDGT repeat protein